MLPELDEALAAGNVATIYREIRETTGVPYVSSLQRHLATRPGWLEWAWSVVGPGFRNGMIPTEVWRCADKLEVPKLATSTAASARSMGLDSEAVHAIRNVLDSFIRVSPTNLGFSGVVRRLLTDVDAVNTPAGSLRIASAPTPLPLDQLPPLIGFESLPHHEQAVLMQMSTRIDGHDFIPGLYRMLAHWPAWFAHSVCLLEDARAEAQLACNTLSQNIDNGVPDFLKNLPLSEPPSAPSKEHERIVAAIDRYRLTSPHMVVYGRMLRDTLPS